MAAFRAGFVAIVGAPNAGKSTLLNALAGRKLAIVSPKPQTTRNRILGIVNGKNHQIAFVDTPGVHRGKSALGRRMLNIALRAIDEVDAALFVVDAAARANGRDPDGERIALQRLKASGHPSILALNKIDRLNKPQLLPLIQSYQERHPFAEIFPVSALRGDGLKELTTALTGLMPQGERMFPEDILTDQAERVICAELVREQMLRQLREEVPHSAAVVVEEFDEDERAPSKGPHGARPGLVRIQAVIFVERDSQKGIVIGKGGKTLKSIGTAAREQIERFLDCRVFLGLVVRVEAHWTDDERALARLGLLDQEQ